MDEKMKNFGKALIDSNIAFTYQISPPVITINTVGMEAITIKNVSDTAISMGLQDVVNGSIVVTP